MGAVKRTSIIDLTVGHLRSGIREGRWKGRMPGLRKLSAELEVSRETLRAALGRLVEEGLLTEGGKSEAHTVISHKSSGTAGTRALRVAILFMQAPGAEDPANRESLRKLTDKLREDGHTCVYVAVPANKDPHKAGYLKRLVEDTGADVWLVELGTFEILEWFSRQPIPVLALGGRCAGLPVAAAGIDTTPIMRESARRLVARGHTRIVLILAAAGRRPTPAPATLAFREELEISGIRVGEFHTPDWVETPEGLEALLEALFRVTPPTALVCRTVNVTTGVLTFLRRRNLRVPEDVSVISIHDDPQFAWIMPGIRIAHFNHADAETAFLRRVRKWIAAVASGEPDKSQSLVSIGMDEGTSIGTARNPRE